MTYAAKVLSGRDAADIIEGDAYAVVEELGVGSRCQYSAGDGESGHIWYWRFKDDPLWCKQRTSTTPAFIEISKALIQPIIIDAAHLSTDARIRGFMNCEFMVSWANYHWHYWDSFHGGVFTARRDGGKWELGKDPRLHLSEILLKLISNEPFNITRRFWWGNGTWDRNEAVVAVKKYLTPKPKINREEITDSLRPLGGHVTSEFTLSSISNVIAREVESYVDARLAEKD